MSGSIVLYMIGLLVDVGDCQRCSVVRSLRASGSRLIACSAGPVLQPSAISDSHDDQDLVRARGTATETVIVSKCANDQESSLWPSGTSRLVPAAATFTFDEITALPPPIAARIGLPSNGCTQAPPCSISPSPPTGALAVGDGRCIEQLDELGH